MSTPVVGLDFQYTIEKETTFGTAVDSASTAIPTENMDINHDFKAHAVPRARGVRGQHEGDTWQDQVGSIPTTSTGFFLTSDTMGWLPAVLQDATDWATSDSTNITMHTNNYTKLPDFSADAGFFYTLGAISPVAAYSETMTSAIGSGMKLSIGPDSNEGALFCEMDWIAKASDLHETQTATVTTPAMTGLYKWSDIENVTFMAQDITDDFYEMEINVANGAKYVPAGGSDNIALPKWEVSGTVTILSGALAEALKSIVESTNPSNGTDMVIEFGSGDMDTATDLKMTVFGVLNGYSTDKSEEEKVTFEFTGLFGGATEYPLTIEYSVI